MEEEEEEELTTTLGMFLAPRVEFGPPRPSRNVATTKGGKATTLHSLKPQQLKLKQVIETRRYGGMIFAYYRISKGKEHVP